MTSWIILVGGCKKGNDGGDDNPPPVGGASEVAFYLTSPDQTNLFKKQNSTLNFAAGSNSNPTITVDTTQTYQTIDGFGYTLTGGSATLMNSLGAAKLDALLKELFLWDS